MSVGMTIALLLTLNAFDSMFISSLIITSMTTSCVDLLSVALFVCDLTPRDLACMVLV